MPSPIDLHMHSAASDGTDSPLLLAETVKAAGIRTFALTDHDTAAGVRQLADRLPDGVTFIPGIEFSCKMTSGKCHILGFGCDMDSAAFQRALAEGSALRRTKLDKRLNFLQEQGIVLPTEEMERLRQLPSVGKPHLGNLLVKYGFAANMQDAIRNTINLCKTGSSRIPAETAVKAILAAGGIPVWAHPLGGEGEKTVSPEQFDGMQKELSGYGLLGLECYYSKYPLAHCKELAETAREHKLLVSGGSDYHGANKPIAPGTLNADGAEIPSEWITVLKALAVC